MSTKFATSEQKDLILHPDRMQIVGEFALGQALTPAQLHERLPEIPLATLYRHLAALTEGGVLAVQETHAKRGTTEKTYALAISLLFSMDDFKAKPQQLLQIVATAASLLVRLFTRYAQKAETSKRSAPPLLRFNAFHATDAEYRELIEDIAGRVLEATKTGAKASTKARRMRLFFTAAIPEIEWKS